MEHQLRQLIKMINGTASERFVPVSADAAQAELFADVKLPEPTTDPTADDEDTQRVGSKGKKRKPRPDLRKLPDHLPVEEHILEPEGDIEGLACIGREVTDTIDYRPGKLVIIRRIRPKYARPTVDEDGTDATEVLIAPLPRRPIERGLAEPGLLAQLCVDKFVDHLPLYRQAVRFERDFGWKVATSTLGDWYAAVCTLLEPLYQELLQAVINTDYLQVDESTIKVLDKTKKGKAHLGYQWVYRNPTNGLILFDYRRGRGAHGVLERLDTFEGYLQTDGYKAYETYLRKHHKATGVSCGAHIRRKFFDARSNHRAGAEQVLTLLQKLYRVEGHCRRRDEVKSSVWRYDSG